MENIVFIGIIVAVIIFLLTRRSVDAVIYYGLAGVLIGVLSCGLSAAPGSEVGSEVIGGYGFGDVGVLFFFGGGLVTIIALIIKLFKKAREASSNQKKP